MLQLPLNETWKQMWESPLCSAVLTKTGFFFIPWVLSFCKRCMYNGCKLLPSTPPPTDRTGSWQQTMTWATLYGIRCYETCLFFPWRCCPVYMTSNWAPSSCLLEVWLLVRSACMDLSLIRHVWQSVEQASTKWKSKHWMASNPSLQETQTFNHK